MPPPPLNNHKQQEDVFLKGSVFFVFSEMASIRKANMTTRHHTYLCKMCGKKDRIGRMVAHILKKHATLDSVPFMCDLCNFRCTEKKELFLHLECYKRHTDQVARTGIKDLSGLLRKSDNPIDLNEYMVDLDAPRRNPSAEESDQSIFEPQDADPILPDWLNESNFDKAPQTNGVMSFPSPKGPQQQLERNVAAPSSILTSAVSHQLPPATGQCLPTAKQPVSFSNFQSTILPSPVTSLVLTQITPTRFQGAITVVTTPVNVLSVPETMPARPSGDLPSTQRASFPTLNLADLVDSPSFSYDPNFTNFSSVNRHQPPAATATKPHSGSATVFNVLNTPVHTRVNADANRTPLRDELYVVDDCPLDQSYTEDPLFIEGRLLESNRQNNEERPPIKVSTSATQVDLPAPQKQPTSQEKILMDILHAIEAN